MKISKYNLSYEKAKEEKLHLINSIPIYEKNSQTNTNRGHFPKLIKDISKRLHLTSYLMLRNQKLSPEIRTKSRMSTVTTLNST